MPRKPTEHRAADGSRTYRVRFRQGGTETSRTFVRRGDADTFAAILAGENGIHDALAWLATKERQEDTATFGDFFEHYVDQLTGITPRTRADYRAMRRRYLTRFDQMPVDLITRSHVATLINDLEKQVSAKTIKNVMHMLSSCMGLAIEEQIIGRNPCRKHRLPQRKHDAEEIQFLTHDEAARLVAALNPYWRPLVIFLLGTGMRWSEATAITGRDVNLANGTVAVRRAWKREPGVGMVLGTPKTAKSKRTVNAATAALVAIQPLLRGPDDLVFTARQGGAVRHGNFYNRAWKLAVEAAGFDPSPNIHALRHTHASWLISDGQSLESVQDQLGHESILTTRGTYGHLLPAIGLAVGRSASAAMDLVLADQVDAIGDGSSLRRLESRSEPDESTQAMHEQQGMGHSRDD